MTWTIQTFILYLLRPHYANARKGRFTAVVDLWSIELWSPTDVIGTTGGDRLTAADVSQAAGTQVSASDQPPPAVTRERINGRKDNENWVSGSAGYERRWSRGIEPSNNSDGMSTV